MPIIIDDEQHIEGESFWQMKKNSTQATIERVLVGKIMFDKQKTNDNYF